jgi:hypothetical protein
MLPCRSPNFVARHVVTQFVAERYHIGPDLTISLLDVLDLVEFTLLLRPENQELVTVATAPWLAYDP